MIYFVIATYQQEKELQVLMNSLYLQNSFEWNYKVYHDGKLPVPDNYKESIYRKINLVETKKRFNDYGHSLRALGLQEATLNDNDYICFTNGDNYYCPVFVDEMMKATGKDVGVVYCDMVHSHNRNDSSSQSAYGYFNTVFEPMKCDIGAFITRFDIAKKVGFNYRHNEADAEFIRQILEYDGPAFKVVKVNKVLFVHN
jgi:hypothetical protein